MMKPTILAAALWMASLSAPAWSQEKDIETVIATQIQAFQSDDFAAAFEFASPTIQRLFKTPENFGQMVKSGYPMIWRPTDVFFVDQIIDDGTILQRLRIVDRSGKEHWFFYEMIQIAGQWKINGVFPIDQAEMNV